MCTPFSPPDTDERERCDRGGAACSDASLGVLPVVGGIQPTKVEPLRVLGHGRAAEARLVKITTAQGRTRICVEKVFSPGLLTRAIYRMAFQAPFAYQSNVDAILACFYRRRVAASIVQATVPGARVARPLYARWDRESKALVLASEYIAGRGIVPPQADSWMVRRWLASRMRLRRRIAPAPAEELRELLERMTQLERVLVESGLTGSGWQVCKRAVVSTANLLRIQNQYVVVDLESGIPSVLVPAYLRAGFSLRSLPLFDDLDADQLRRWTKANESRLARHLLPAHREQLGDDIERLIHHTTNWKESEPALGRRPTRLLGRAFRQRFRQRVLDHWQRRAIVDAERLGTLRGSRRLISRPEFVCGLIPGKLGRFLQRLWGNAAYRREAKRWVGDRAYRRQRLDQWAADRVRRWQADGRHAADGGEGTFTPSFVVQWGLSKTTPVWVHRWCSDSRYRQNRLTRLWLLGVSRRFQSDFGRLMIRARIDAWRREERLSDDAAAALVRELNSPMVNEYVRCFGLHVGLKLLMPFVWSLKVGGAAASVASGNPFYFLFTLMLVPLLRTAVTLWRMLVGGRPASEYREALLVGLLPVIGSLAYPIQMYSRFSALSLFMMRDFAARVGRLLPIYGGRDSRTEMVAIKGVNLIVEGLELWLATLRTSRLTSASTVNEPAISDRVLAGRVEADATSRDRWDRMAREQAELMSCELGLASPSANPSAVRKIA